MFNKSQNHIIHILNQKNSNPTYINSENHTHMLTNHHLAYNHQG